MSSGDNHPEKQTSFDFNSTRAEPKSPESPEWNTEAESRIGKLTMVFHGGLNPSFEQVTNSLPTSERTAAAESRSADDDDEGSVVGLDRPEVPNVYFHVASNRGRGGSGVAPKSNSVRCNCT